MTDRPSREYYESLEVKVLELVRLVEGSLPEADVDQVRQFVDHAEYGEALLWACGAISELGLVVGPDVRQIVLDLAEAMGMVDELPVPFSRDAKDRR